MLNKYKRAHDINAFHAQNNNGTESMLRKLGVKNYLETCGPTALINAVEILDPAAIERAFGLAIKWAQPEDIVTLLMNNPTHYSIWENVRKNYDYKNGMVNRVPQILAYVASTVFGLHSIYLDTGNTKDEIIEDLVDGKLRIVCKGGLHYQLVVDYDEKTDEFIINDSLATQQVNKNGGFNERKKADEYIKSLASYYISLCKD